MILADIDNLYKGSAVLTLKLTFVVEYSLPNSNMVSEFIQDLLGHQLSGHPPFIFMHQTQ
jgi:hypothetical protein